MRAKPGVERVRANGSIQLRLPGARSKPLERGRSLLDPPEKGDGDRHIAILV
jgi:hypothetical protein